MNRHYFKKIGLRPEQEKTKKILNILKEKGGLEIWQWL